MSKTLRKILIVLLAAAMVVSCAACGNSGTSAASSAAATAAPSAEPTATAEPETEEPAELVKYLYEIDGGEITTALAEEGGGEVSYDCYTADDGKDYTDEEVYTFHDALGSTTGMNWSPMNWETADDDTIGSLLVSGLYGFAFNSDLTGWAVSMEMATEPAEDVTAEYVGQYGIEEGDTNKAFKFKLNEMACWDDEANTPINADTYIYSYQQLLDPLMKNRRADSVYAGEFCIYNAKNYFYAGAASFTSLGDLGYATVADALAGGYTDADIYIDCWEFWGAEGYIDANGNEVDQYISITDETPYSADGAGSDEFTGAGLYADYFAEGADYEDYAPDYCGCMVAGEAVTWDDVGIFKTGEYEIVLVLANPIDSPNYYVPYNMSSTYLVYEPLWESCKSYFDADGNTVSAGDPNVASITTNYGTTVDTTISYGPYRLTYFELDKSIKLERNDSWYGYHDGNHLGQYQTDIYDISILTEHETELLSFLNGELDTVSLQSADMETYGTSDYIRYEPQTYTTKLSWDTEDSSLAERGTQILESLKFRQAWSLAIDRTTFAQSYTSAGSAGYGMLNYVYVYDPYTGATYRDTDAAKAALCDLYGLTWGDDGDFDDLDEAYEAITGYDLAQAQELMQQAYDELVAAGLYDGTSTVTIQLDVYQSDDIYVQMFNYLNSALQDACAGTDFEGKVSMTMVANSDYYETMYSGGTDMIFTTWGGAAYSPYTMLYECYCDASDGSGNQMEYGFDTSEIMVTLTVDGVEYTDSLQNWALWCDSSENEIVSADGKSTLLTFGEYDAQTRAMFFSRLEYAYLANYVTTPIYYRNVGFLVSQKGDYPVTQYVDLMGFGGIQYYTYNYTDTEWAAIASTLTY